MNLRILSVLPNLNGGGAQRIALDLARQFAMAGDESVVCAAGSAGALRIEVGGLPFYGLEQRITLRTLVPFVSHLRRTIREVRPQVILTHLLPLNLLVLMLSALRLVRTPVVVVEHGHLSASEESDGATPLRRWLTGRMIRSLYPTASAVIGVSEPVARDIASRMRVETNLHAIPNGIDVVTIARRAIERTTASDVVDSLPTPTLVAVGRLVPLKGFNDLLEAFALVRSRSATASPTLVILGEGPERGSLERQASRLGIQDAVVLPGFVANPWAVMARADMFVLSSRHEGFGLVVAEAVACGLPVVSTDCRSGPAEILAGNARSRLVPVGDPHAMADAIVELLVAARDIPAASLREEFTIATTGRRYRELLAEVVSSTD